MPTLDIPQALRLVAARKYSTSGAGKQIRIRAGLSQPEVAQVIGASVTTVSCWELGTRRPTGTPALKWVDLLDQLAAVESAAA